MRRLFSALFEETEKGNDVLLVRIVANRGSAPRGSGAGMLVGITGRITGSVGGGAIEYKAEQMAMKLLAEKKSVLHEFVLRPNGKEDIGMQCGGDVTMLFTYVPAGDSCWSLLLNALTGCLEAGKEGWLICPLNGELPSLCGKNGLLAGAPVPDALLEELCRRGSVCEEGYYCEPLPLPSRVVIFGGGHIAQSLVPMLPRCDFECVVLDSRAEYAQPELFPEARETICCDYERIPDYITLTEEDFVVVMTNGHAHDLTVENQVLRLPHAYLGVVGSASKIRAVNEKLRALGISEAELETVHTPIGMPIRAVTPAEIAVSILGELILCRAQMRDGSAHIQRDCPMHDAGA